MTLFGFLLSHKKVSGADGITPAWFPISSQRIGGEPEFYREELYKLLFFCIIHTIKKNFIYEDYYSHVWDEQSIL